MVELKVGKETRKYTLEAAARLLALQDEQAKRGGTKGITIVSKDYFWDEQARKVAKRKSSKSEKDS